MPRLKLHATTLSFYCARLLAFVVCMTFWTLPITPQVTRQGNPNSGSIATSQINLLIAEAKAADTEEGDQQYARRLSDWYVSRRAGDAYITSFSHRLATADLMARHGKRKWIPESVIVQAFNSLMKQVTYPSSKLVQTNTNVVHRLRVTLSEVSPALSTVNSSSSECLPTEAVSLMIQLQLHNGSTEDPCPTTPDANGHLVQLACSENANILVFSYLHSHPASESVKIFDHVAKLFDM
jgi:hypothetical protein